MPKYRKFDPEDLRLIGKASLPLSHEERRFRHGLVGGFGTIYRKLLTSLLDHYGLSKVDEDRWYLLALNLAMDRVPGFIYGPRRRGRKLKDDWFALVSEIDIIRTEHRIGIAKACDRLSERRQAPWTGDSRVLETTYHDLRRRIKGDPILNDLYEDWNMYRNQTMPSETDIPDESVTRWNGLSKPELAAELRDVQPQFVELFRILSRPVPIHSNKPLSSLFAPRGTPEN